MKASRLLRLRALVVLMGLVAAGCAPTQDEEQTTATSPSPRAAASPAPKSSPTPDYVRAYGQYRQAYSQMFETGDRLAAAVSAQKTLGDPKGGGADLRVNLNRLLGESAWLAAFTMQKAVQDAQDLEAASVALNDNASNLAATVGTYLDGAARSELLRQWQEQNRLLVEFARATGRGDETGRATAIGDLAALRAPLASVLASASGASNEQIASRLGEEVSRLTAATDAHRAKDYPKAYDASQAAANMFDTADLLAAGIAQKQNLGPTAGGASDLRVSLDRRLGDHTFLVVFALQKRVSKQEDVPMLAASLDRNAGEVSAVLGGLYDDPWRSDFLRQWREMNRLLLEFAGHAADEFLPGRMQAINGLAVVKNQLGELLAVTGMRADEVGDLLQEHIREVTTSVDTFSGSPLGAVLQEHLGGGGGG